MTADIDLESIHRHLRRAARVIISCHFMPFHAISCDFMPFHVISCHISMYFYQLYFILYFILLRQTDGLVQHAQDL